MNFVVVATHFLMLVFLSSRFIQSHKKVASSNKFFLGQSSASYGVVLSQSWSLSAPKGSSPKRTNYFLLPLK